MNPNPNDSCAICSKEPQDMLLLECSHNLCLDCATELFAATQDSSLQCEICFVSTRLDEETVQCLSSLAAQTLSHPTHAIEVLPIPRPPKESRGMQCMEHREKALYYCFDCQVGTICSECILGTTHAGHKVLTLKKASKMLVENLVGQTRGLEELRMRLEGEAEGARVRREELVAQLQERQKKLKIVFDDMIRQITARYNELSTELDKLFLRNIEMAQGYLNSTSDKVLQIQSIIQQNKEVLQQNDSDAVLRRFTQLQNNPNAFISEDPPSLPQNTLYLRQEDAVFVQLESLLKRIVWQSTDKTEGAEWQRMGEGINIRIEGSLLESGGYPYPELGESHLREKEMNQSVNRYSGIKGNSRRLQLSRSMDNATNIINKLQQRMRK